MSELFVPPEDAQEDIEEALGVSPGQSAAALLDPLSGQLGIITEEAVNPAIEKEIKEATGITALEDEQARLEQESAAQRKEFASLLEEAQAAPTEASRTAALARRRRRAGATRQSTRVSRGQQSPGATGRTTLGG